MSCFLHTNFIFFSKKTSAGPSIMSCLTDLIAILADNIIKIICYCSIYNISNLTAASHLNLHSAQIVFHYDCTCHA